MPPLIDGRLRAEVFRSIDGIGQHVVSTSKQYFRSETGVVAVLTSASVFEQLLAPTPAVSDQLSRVNEDITVLSVAETASMHGRIGKYSKSDGVFVPTSDYQLDDVRNYHLRCLFEPFGAAAIRRSGETFHYVAPSGLHCVAFLRLADALRSMQIIEGFSFWLHEHVAGADAVILDTWGIDRLLFRSLIRSAADRPYRCLEQYPESDGEISTLVSQLLASSPRPDDRPLRLLLLVSVNSSGTLISRVTRAVQEANESIELSVVSLVAIGPSAMSSAAFMKLPEVDPENATAENCKRCPLPAYRIDPRHYYQRAPFEQEIQLKARYFKGPSRKFLDKFGKHPGLVKLHEPLPLGPSHRAFDIEASILLSLAEAKEEIEHKLDDDRAGLILTIGPAASTIGKNFADKKSIGWLDASSIVGTREPDETEKAVLGTDGAVSLIVEKIGDVHLAQAIGRFLRDHVLRASQVRVLFCLDICASEEVAAAVKKQIEDNGAKFRPQKSEPVFVCRLPDAAFPSPWCFELEWLEKKSSRWWTRLIGS